jgi:hypothetical protein
MVFPFAAARAAESLFVPASAHAPGVGDTFFVTDLRIFNPGTLPVPVTILFTPKDADGATARILRSETLAALETRFYPDILEDTFGLANMVGALEIRPSGGGVIATSRTYNETAIGSFGQFIAARPASEAAGLGTTLHLLQVGKSADLRANVGFCETTGNPASVMVEIWDDHGARLGGSEFPVSAWGMKQLNDVFATLGVAARPVVRVTLRVTSGSGRILGYASVVDNNSTDQICVPAQQPPAAGERLFVAAGASASGASESLWRTDLRIANVSGEFRTVKLALLPNGSDNSLPVTKSYGLAAGEVKALDDAVAGEFAATGSAGFLVAADPATATGILATSRTYNVSASGTFGQFIPALPASAALAAGEGRATSLGIDRSDAYRANVGFLNTTTAPGQVRVRLLSGAGTPLASRDYDLSPWSPMQLNDVFAVLGVPWQTNARVDFELISGSAELLGYASVIDNRTNDPVYVPARPWPEGSAGQPDLLPVVPTGWSGSIVVSTVAGSSTDGSPVGGSPVWVDLAATNGGTAAAGPFAVRLEVDGTVAMTWSVTGLAVGANWTATDWTTTLAAGSHTLKLVIDAASAVAESNEANNQAERTLSWSVPALPDLVPTTPSGWSGPIVVSTVTGTSTDGTPIGGAVAYVDVALKNSGTAAAGAFTVLLKVDGATSKSWNVGSLAVGATWTQTDWAINLAAGSHALALVVDSGGSVAESNETNNEATKSTTWTTSPVIVSDDFEGAILSSGGGLWDIFADGAYSWGRTACDKASGTYSMDGIRGAAGASLGCSATTPQEPRTKLALHSPISVKGTSAPRLRFKIRGKSSTATDSGGNPLDYFAVLVSADGYSYYGYPQSGDLSGGWQSLDYNLKGWYGLGDLRMYDQLWFWFHQQVTSAVPIGYGFRVDDFSVVANPTSAEGPDGTNPERGIAARLDPESGEMVILQEK